MRAWAAKGKLVTTVIIELCDSAIGQADCINDSEECVGGARRGRPAPPPPRNQPTAASRDPPSLPPHGTAERRNPLSLATHRDGAGPSRSTRRIGF